MKEKLELFGWTITPETEPWSIEHQGNRFKAVNDEGEVKAAKTLQELITEIAEEQEQAFKDATSALFRSARCLQSQEDALVKRIEELEGDVERWEGISDGKQLVINQLEKEIADLMKDFNHQKQSHE